MLSILSGNINILVDGILVGQRLGRMHWQRSISACRCILRFVLRVLRVYQRTFGMNTIQIYI